MRQRAKYRACQSPSAQIKNIGLSYAKYVPINMGTYDGHHDRYWCNGSISGEPLAWWRVWITYSQRQVSGSRIIETPVRPPWRKSLTNITAKFKKRIPLCQSVLKVSVFVIDTKPVEKHCFFHAPTSPPPRKNACTMSLPLSEPENWWFANHG